MIKPVKSKSILKVDDFNSRQSNLKVLPQRGTVKSLVRDRGRKALLPGKRVSRSGKVYWETRKNRSDALNKKV